MRKIASAKENPHIWKTQVTCNGKGWQQTGTPCYSLFEIDATDIRKRTHSDYTGDTETYYGIVCPECGCFTEIPASHIPYDVKNNARKYVKQTSD